MRLFRIVLSSTLMIATTLPALAYMHSRRGPTSPSLFKKRASGKSSTKVSGHQLGPRAMDSGRATEIQNALIKQGYLTGTPSGHWDAQSEAAMQKLQGAQGWQTKLTPDSRALILLGLGPNQGHESAAMISTGIETASTVRPNPLTQQ